MAEKTSSKPPPDTPTIIKKYANRRLYDTSSSAYVTLEDLARMVQQGIEFVVQDAKTKEDLTRSVLTQIIVEEEQKGTNLLPISFLRQLITAYGDSMRWMMPQYLESMAAAFALHQEQMRKQLQNSLGVFPFGPLEEVGKKNLAMFEQAMQMFNPFAPRQPSREEPASQADRPPSGPQSSASPAGRETDVIDEMRRQLASMQQQIDALNRGKQE